MHKVCRLCTLFSENLESLGERMESKKKNTLGWEFMHDQIIKVIFMCVFSIIFFALFDVALRRKQEMPYELSVEWPHYRPILVGIQLHHLR